MGKEPDEYDEMWMDGNNIVSHAVAKDPEGFAEWDCATPDRIMIGLTDEGDLMLNFGGNFDEGEPSWEEGYILKGGATDTFLNTIRDVAAERASKSR